MSNTSRSSLLVVQSCERNREIERERDREGGGEETEDKHWKEQEKGYGLLSGCCSCCFVLSSPSTLTAVHA